MTRGGGSAQGWQLFDRVLGRVVGVSGGAQQTPAACAAALHHCVAGAATPSCHACLACLPRLPRLPACHPCLPATPACPPTGLPAGAGRPRAQPLLSGNRHEEAEEQAGAVAHLLVCCILLCLLHSAVLCCVPLCLVDQDATSGGARCPYASARKHAADQQAGTPKQAAQWAFRQPSPPFFLPSFPGTCRLCS